MATKKEEIKEVATGIFPSFDNKRRRRVDAHGKGIDELRMISVKDGNVYSFILDGKKSADGEVVIGQAQQQAIRNIQAVCSVIDENQEVITSPVYYVEGKNQYLPLNGDRRGVLVSGYDSNPEIAAAHKIFMRARKDMAEQAQQIAEAKVNEPAPKKGE